MIKRKLLFGATFLFVAWAFTSCEALSKCKMCKNVVYEGSNIITPGSPTEYCGADLIKQEAIPDYTVGAFTTKVECN